MYTPTDPKNTPINISKDKNSDSMWYTLLVTLASFDAIYCKRVPVKNNQVIRITRVEIKTMKNNNSNCRVNDLLV